MTTGDINDRCFLSLLTEKYRNYLSTSASLLDLFEKNRRILKLLLAMWWEAIEIVFCLDHGFERIYLINTHYNFVWSH